MLRTQIRDARDKGFTLIELLIVIVVLGILAGIVVFGVSTFRADAEKSACQADFKTTSVAADAYLAKTGTAAASMTDLTSNGYLKTAPKASSAITVTAGVVSSTACTAP
jgi:prepilin-type N-terminal cleavage/methylation domain-containing protein